MIACKLVALNCLCYEENTCPRQPMCQQTVLRFLISETFYNSIVFVMINNYGEGAAIQFSTVFGPVYHVACCLVLLNRTFRQLSNHVFQSL